MLPAKLESRQNQAKECLRIHSGLSWSVAHGIRNKSNDLHSNDDGGMQSERDYSTYFQAINHHGAMEANENVKNMHFWSIFVFSLF